MYCLMYNNIMHIVAFLSDKCIPWAYAIIIITSTTIRCLIRGLDKRLNWNYPWCINEKENAQITNDQLINVHHSIQPGIQPTNSAWYVAWWCLTSYQRLRSYQEGYQLVTLHTHGNFIVLPHWETRLAVQWHYIHPSQWHYPDTEQNPYLP